MPFILLLLPNLYLWGYSQEYSSLLLSICCLFLLLAFFKTTKYSFLFLPFLWIIPFYLYYISIYQTSINEQILSIVLETNFQEILSFLGEKIYNYVIYILIWNILCIYFCYKCYKRPAIWIHRSRYWVLSVFIFYFIVSYISQQKISNTINNNFTKQNDFLVQEDNNFLQELKKTYPIGLIISFNKLYIEQNKVKRAFSKNKDFKFNTIQHAQNNRIKEVYILIIGETSRKHNWSLNGYQRETNPLLNQQKNLVNFDNMLSISTATRSSIPMMITRKPAQQVYRYDFPERSIISAFKETGFSTYWISTQQKFGAFDTSTSVYAKEADYMLFLNKTSYSNRGDTDEIIFPELKKAIQSAGDKKFIVIHTLGSHYNYSHRYTNNFDIFRPSLNNIKNYSMQDKRYKTELLNSYDNSILYTDYVLNELIEILKMQKDTESFVFFASDHGEDLFDNECNKSGHGNTTIYNYEIASFAWYSDLYQQRNPTKINWLEQNKQRKINQTSIFPTLIDAANLKIPNDSLDKSILKDFKNYPRLVEGGIDFDKTQPQGVCKEIQ